MILVEQSARSAIINNVQMCPDSYRDANVQMRFTNARMRAGFKTQTSNFKFL